MASDAEIVQGNRVADGLKVRFWGVRGSISCSGAEYARYGGNTSCLEVTAGGRRLIFDAGTGIRTLGLELARLAPLDIDIYFTHTHLDHISGLTFFAPLFDAGSSVRLWAGHLQAPHTLKKVVSNLMVDLKPTNVKLRDRAVRIVRTLTGCDEDVAREALQRTNWVIKDAVRRLK